jgi:hypothetical protein
MSSVIALSRPSASPETIRAYTKGLLERAHAPAHAPATEKKATRADEEQTQRLLRTLVRSRSDSAYSKLADSVKDALGPNASGKIQAADLVSAGVSLRDIESTGVTPRALAEFRIVRSLEAWQQLGIKSASELFSHVGLPRKLRKWMSSPDWTTLAAALSTPSGGPRRPVWWSPEVWLAMAAALDPRDLRALGVNLDAWFEADRALEQRARKIASSWLTKFPRELWEKSGVLRAATYAKIVSLPVYF